MDEKDIGFCPRCGRELVRGATPTGKVCFRCPSCGGMAVTLPVLRESLDAKSIAALTRSARAAEHVGCLCPGCAGRMTLLKVGDGKDKLEIDVCGRCLSVWCDKGEYETLAPPAPPRPGEATMRQILERATPEARERYAASMLDSLPEEVSPGDYDIGDILRDVARIVVGAPTLWRTVKPVSPIFTIALALALPIVHACVFYCCHDITTEITDVGVRGRVYYRSFWVLTEAMAEKCGFDISSPLAALTFPFVQMSGRYALIFAFLLFLPLAVVERRAGHRKFIGLFLAFTAASAVAHAVFAGLGLASGRLVGIAPIALGYLAYSSFAWPELRIRDKVGLLSVYAWIVGLAMLSWVFLRSVACDYFSLGLGPIVACVALGAFLGQRSRKQ
jgi:Zn-finger nucleic acid-binding protein/membrane associated rhomboid family serine protease